MIASWPGGSAADSSNLALRLATSTAVLHFDKDEQLVIPTTNIITNTPLSSNDVLGAVVFRLVRSAMKKA